VLHQSLPGRNQDHRQRHHSAKRASGRRILRPAKPPLQNVPLTLTTPWDRPSVFVVCLQIRMDPRPYIPADLPHSLPLTEPTDRKSLQAFLQTPPTNFFVLEHNRQILGAGGYTLSNNNTQASLVWGIIRKDLRKQGLGRFLLMYRLREIAKTNTVQTVRVE